MYKKIFICICFLIFAVIIWILSSNLRGWIAGHYTGFIQACRQLNGKELTYDNIKSLNGNCYKKCEPNGQCISIGKCEEKHIQQYIKLKAKCGDYQGEEPAKVLYDADEKGDYHPIDPYYRCIDDYLRENKHDDLAISSMGTFSISQNGLDGAWVCRISTINSKLRATPAFSED